MLFARQLLLTCSGACRVLRWRRRGAQDVGTGAAVAIDSAGWTDAVVWNPHLTMKDSYERFVCVEQAKVGQAVVLKPGESWSGKANFSVVELSA